VLERHRFEATQALRQVLNRAVDWGLIDSNPARRGIRNPPPRAPEAAVRVVAADRRPSPRTSASSTDPWSSLPLRPDSDRWSSSASSGTTFDRDARVVYVRRAYANGRLEHTKTRLSNRAAPLQAKALEALDRLPYSENEILFPNARGGRIDFRSFGRRQWKPAQRAAGIEPPRDLYDLRHTYATFAVPPRLPCNNAVLSAGSILSLKRLEPPWESSDLSPNLAPPRSAPVRLDRDWTARKHRPAS
jgi:hypothetical protein